MDASNGSETLRLPVMVFDCSCLIRPLMDEVLHEAGYDATVSTFRSASFDQIAESPPVLLIIDLGFKEQAGWELLERLAHEAVTQTIPVIVTATDERLLERAKANRDRYGGCAWLSKPFELDQFLTEVRRLTTTVSV